MMRAGGFCALRHFRAFRAFVVPRCNSKVFTFGSFTTPVVAYKIEMQKTIFQPRKARKSRKETQEDRCPLNRDAIPQQLTGALCALRFFRVFRVFRGSQCLRNDQVKAPGF